MADQPRERRDRVRAWLAALYPPTTPGTCWGSVQPDRLAERFFGRHLHDHANLVDHLLGGTTRAQATQLLTVYARAAAHPVFTGALDLQLTEACMRHRHALAEPAIQVATQVEAPSPLLTALQHLLQDPAVNPIDLQRWANELPHTSHVLAEWAAHLFQHLVTHHRNHADPSGLANSLNSLSNRLSELGRHEEELAAITEAIEIRRQLAETRPDTFLPDLTMSLNNLSNRLGVLGRHEEGLPY